MLKSNEQLPSEKYLFYGGAVNEARGFEVLIPAMKQIPFKLVIAGDGNFMPQLKRLIEENGVEHKVELKGMVSPDELRLYTSKATLGLGLAEGDGLNQYLALPNKFFDYMHAGLPHIAMNFPEYQKMNNIYEVAILLEDLSESRVVSVISQAMNDDQLLQKLRLACLQARKVFNWNTEQQKLIQFYKSIL